MFFTFELLHPVVELLPRLCNTGFLFGGKQRRKRLPGSQLFNIFYQRLRGHGALCVFLFKACTVQIEQLHRAPVKFIAYLPNKLGHFLDRKFFTAYYSVSNRLRLVQRFLCLFIKHDGIFRLRENIVR